MGHIGAVMVGQEGNIAGGGDILLADAVIVDGGDVVVAEGLALVTEAGVLCRFRQRNKISLGDSAELLTPSRVGIPTAITELYDETGAPIESAPHPLMIFYTRLPVPAAEGDILRAGD